MIVVVESNFVLELAFRQEEVSATERIMALASEKAIELVIPACALFEPFETLIRRGKERNETGNRFTYEMKQLARSQHFPDLLRTFEAVARVLAESVQTEAAALDSAILRILDCARVIPMSGEVLRTSFGARTLFPFSPQDSIVFASADRYLNERGRAESVFANKNSKDFAVPEVKKHFSDLNCKVLSTFADTVGLIDHRARAG